MPPTESGTPVGTHGPPQIAHVLFMDVVSYSQLPTDHQMAVREGLKRIVLGLPEFQSAVHEGLVISRDTGDGMALAFFGDLTAPVICARRIAQALQSDSRFALRMGIHTGPVYVDTDINAAQNLAGDGINIAQRVMDCGDAGHILLSKTTAGMLGQLSAWRPALHDLGETEVKHGVRLHICNLFTPEFGNAALPNKVIQSSARGAARTSILRRWWRVLALGVGLTALVACLILFWPTAPKASTAGLQWYRRGADAIREGTYYTAVLALEQSLKDSPKYVLTHASLAEAWLELDSPERANEEMLRANPPGNSGRAMPLRDSERIEAIHATLTRDFAKAESVYSQLAKTAAAADLPRALVDLGRALERSNKERKAMAQYERAVQLDPTYAGAWLRLAVTAGQLRLSQQMADALQRAESLYQAGSNLEGVTEVYYQRGAYANRQSRFSEAGDWLEKARQTALATHNPHQQIRAMYQLSSVAYQKGAAAEAQRIAEEAIHYARSSNIEFLAGRGYLDLGNAMATRGDFVKARESFTELLRIAHYYHNGMLEATALYSLGSIANRGRANDAGANQVQQALAWFQGNGYPTEASYCLIALGRYQRNRGDFAAASEAFVKLLELARASHDDPQTALALSSIVSILIRQERFPEALDLTLQQLAVSTRMGDGLMVAYAQETLSQLYAELGRFSESENLARQSEAAARKGNIEGLLADVAVTRADALRIAGHTQEAAAIAARAIQVYGERGTQQAGELFEIMAVTRTGTPFQTRWDWSEKGLQLVQGSLDAELSVHLTQAQMLVEARKPQRALDLYAQIRAPLEREQREYSLFRAELIAGLASRQLGLKDNDAVTRAGTALDRFKKRFGEADWKLFQQRSDFRGWENSLKQLRF